MTPFDVVGLGVSVIDILQLVDHLPEREEVQRAAEMTIQGGGPVATAMVTLARLGARVAMLDAVGDDWRGDLIRKEFEREGVCTDHIQLREGYGSSLASVLVTKDDGARAIVVYPGTAPNLTPTEVPRSVIESASLLHVNGRHWGACLQACVWAQEAGVRVSMDGGASLYRPELRQLVPLTDICIVARDFAESFTGESNIHRAARQLVREGPTIVTITDGVRGSWVLSRDGQAFHQQAYLLPDVVDTTGCGDSYHGAFLYGLLKGMSLTETASLASAVAALNSQSLGGRAGLPTYEQVKSFLANV
jgi:sugar/nucleoside kinase (ribokinase family)